MRKLYEHLLMGLWNGLLNYQYFIPLLRMFENNHVGYQFKSFSNCSFCLETVNNIRYQINLTETLVSNFSLDSVNINLSTHRDKCLNFWMVMTFPCNFSKLTYAQDFKLWIFYLCFITRIIQQVKGQML